MVYLSVPCKKGTEISFENSVVAYVKTSYGEEQAVAVKDAVCSLVKLRNKILTKLSDKHEPTIRLLTQYHDQIMQLESRVPMTESDLRIDFKWSHAFLKDTAFTKYSAKMACSAYERVCVLFCVAAMQSQIAELQNLSDPNALQVAVKAYQNSDPENTAIPKNSGPLEI